MRADDKPFPHSSIGGIRMRDYIAIKAMQGICAQQASYSIPTKEIVTDAYEIADAMLAESEKGKV